MIQKIERIPTPLLEYTQSFFAFTHHLSGHKRPRFATLGPSGTSSESAARFLLSTLEIEKGEVCLFATFEDAFESMLNGSSDFLLVANAYDRINTFYMSMEAQFIFSFVFKTAPYGLAKRADFKIPRANQLAVATHPAPVSLIPYFLSMYAVTADVILVRSTSEAAQKTRDGEFDLCVTNALAAKEYQLEFASPVFAIKMLWSVFCRRTLDEYSLKEKED
jgi:bacilysin biosynthesis protein BacA